MGETSLHQLMLPSPMVALPFFSLICFVFVFLSALLALRQSRENDERGIATSLFGK